MNYHNLIMNISSEQYKVCWSEEEFRIYKIGHRDARHAAAELAIQADARIEELEKALQDLISASIFKDACNVAGNYDKRNFAYEQYYNILDKAKITLDSNKN